MLRLFVPLLVGLLPATALGWALRTSDKGEVLVWSPSAVTLEVSTAGMAADAAAYQAVQAAFLTWTASGAPLAVQFEQRSGSLSASRDGHSTLSWVNKGWKYGDDVVGMTIAWYHPSTALVDETDIVLNLRDHSWATGAPGPTRFDVQNVVTHEAGHFFGLAHEPSLPADVMYPVTPPGETQKRVLKADDRAGLAALVLETNSRVGPRPQSTISEPTSLTAVGPTDSMGGCSMGRGSPAGLAWTLVILTGLRLGGRCRRRAGARPFVAVLLVLALTPSVSRASAVVALSVEELAARADLVASGVVVRQTAAVEEDGLIYTRVELRTERCYRGACRGGTVAVQIPGGEVGELGMAVEGVPRVRLGERVLLFAVRRGARLALLGLGLGLFRLQGRLARRDLGGLVLVEGRALPPAQLPLVELEAAIARGLRVRPLPSLPGPAAR
jgi:hypothetical protein